jgi:hypothetical protein
VNESTFCLAQTFFNLRMVTTANNSNTAFSKQHLRDEGFYLIKSALKQHIDARIHLTIKLSYQ